MSDGNPFNLNTWYYFLHNWIDEVDHVIVSISTTMEYECKNSNVDMIYIDSDHSSENVEKKIKLWLPKIKQCGYISGHDFNMPTVFNIVTKYFDPTLIEIFNDTSWVYKMNDYNNDI